MKKICKSFILFLFMLLLVSCKNNEQTKLINITFDGDGGELVSGIVNQTVAHSSEIIPPTFTKEGYIFKGWDIDYYNATDDTNIKALWEEIKYLVTFDVNGGALKSYQTQTVKYGNKITEPLNPTLTGYLFDGWYYNDEKWDFATSTVTKDITLVAKWIDNEFTITFDSNGGSIVPKCYVARDELITEPTTPTKEGYSFDGWYYNDEKWDFSVSTVIKDIKLEAKWSINQYKLTIKYNDEVTDDLVLNYNYNETISMVNTPSRKGYEFVKWNNEIPTKMPSNDVVIEAMWKINQYTFTFKFNDGTDDMVITQEYDTPINIPTLSRTGYTFLGWSTEIPTKMPDKDMVVEAMWKINQYTLTIKYNDEVTQDLVVTQDYNSNIASINNPTRTGYTFLGWSTEIPTKMPDKDMVVEASWKINQYTLTIKYNDGVTNDLIITQDYDTDIRSINPPTRTGYEFLGWSEEIPTKMLAKDLIIEAYWKSIIYTLTIKYNDGVTNDLIITDYYGSNIPTVVTPTRTDYEFLGWSAEIPTKMPDNDVVIEASWKQVIFTLTIKYNDGVHNNMIIKQKANTNIPRIDEPNKIKTGYTYNGWSEEIPTKMPEKDTTIECIWTPYVKYVIENNIAKVTGYNISNDILILSSYEGYPTTKIADEAFKGCKELVNITFPDTIKEIGASAFRGCSNLVIETLPSNLETMGAYAFAECDSIVNMTIPGTLIDIPDYAFYACSKLKELHTSYDTTTIGNHAFDSCVSLDYVYVIPSLTTIGDYAFANCTALPNFTLDRITSVGSYCFSGCTSLYLLLVGNGLTSIGSYALYNCSSLEIIALNTSESYWNSIVKGENWDLNTGNYNIIVLSF